MVPAPANAADYPALFYRLVEGAVATPPKPYKDLKAGSDRLFRVS